MEAVLVTFRKEVFGRDRDFSKRSGTPIPNDTRSVHELTDGRTMVVPNYHSSNVDAPGRTQPATDDSEYGVRVAHCTSGDDCVEGD